MGYPSNSADSVAQDQIKSFVDRIRRDDIDTPSALAASIEGRDERLAYCLDRLAPFERNATIAVDRARSAAGKLLGCSSDMVIHRASMVRRRGSVTAALKSLDWMPQPVWSVPAIGSGLVGFVYAMAATDFPGVFKVGFSVDPARRLRELQAKHRIALSLVTTAPGTRVDESMIHHEMLRFALANEWFDLLGNWKAPTTPFLTPDRMWREMRVA